MDATGFCSLQNHGNNYFNSGIFTDTIHNGGSNGCDSIATLILTVNNCSVTLNLKLYIEGFYTGNGFMVPLLYNNSQSNGDSLITDPTVCDTIIVELHDTIAPYNLLSSTTTILHINGDATALFPGSFSGGTYYVAIKHRNAVETWSKEPVTISGATTIDFINQ